HLGADLTGGDLLAGAERRAAGLGLAVLARLAVGVALAARLVADAAPALGVRAAVAVLGAGGVAPAIALGFSAAVVLVAVDAFAAQRVGLADRCAALLTRLRSRVLRRAGVRARAAECGSPHRKRDRQDPARYPHDSLRAPPSGDVGSCALQAYLVSQGRTQDQPRNGQVCDDAMRQT